MGLNISYFSYTYHITTLPALRCRASLYSLIDPNRELGADRLPPSQPTSKTNQLPHSPVTLIRLHWPYLAAKPRSTRLGLFSYLAGWLTWVEVGLPLPSPVRWSAVSAPRGACLVCAASASSAPWPPLTAAPLTVPVCPPVACLPTPRAVQMLVCAGCRLSSAENRPPPRQPPAQVWKRMYEYFSRQSTAEVSWTEQVCMRRLGACGSVCARLCACRSVCLSFRVRPG